MMCLVSSAIKYFEIRINFKKMFYLNPTDSNTCSNITASSFDLSWSFIFIMEFGIGCNGFSDFVGTLFSVTATGKKKSLELEFLTFDLIVLFKNSENTLT